MWPPLFSSCRSPSILLSTKLQRLSVDLWHQRPSVQRSRDPGTNSGSFQTAAKWVKVWGREQTTWRTRCTNVVDMGVNTSTQNYLLPPLNHRRNTKSHVFNQIIIIINRRWYRIPLSRGDLSSSLKHIPRGWLYYLGTRNPQERNIFWERFFVP